MAKRSRAHSRDGNRGREAEGRCRIIAGSLRGRVVRFDDAEGLRPTTDRVRETVFNWLQPVIAGRRCLDAFAGSGTLGFEALSRGAAHVTFVENTPASADRLRSNADVLLGQDAASSVRVVDADVMQWLGTGCDVGAEDAGFGLVFLDPPYRSDLLSDCCLRLQNSRCLRPDAIIYIEHAVEDEIELPGQWSCIREKQTANIDYGLYMIDSVAEM